MDDSHIQICGNKCILLFFIHIYHSIFKGLSKYIEYKYTMTKINRPQY